MATNRWYRLDISRIHRYQDYGHLSGKTWAIKHYHILTLAVSIPLSGSKESEHLLRSQDKKDIIGQHQVEV